MNNIDILEEFIKEPQKEEETVKIGSEEYKLELFNIEFKPTKKVAQAISTLIAENKELKEKNDRYEEIYKNYGIDDLVQELEKYRVENKELKEKNEKMEELLKEIENRNYNDYTGCQDGNEVKYNILLELQSLLGKE